MESNQKALKDKSSYSLLKKRDSSWAIDDLDKTKTFKTHFTEVFKPHVTEINPTFHKEIDEFLSSSLSLPLKAFFPAEAQHDISIFPKKKAPGSDLITFKIAKNLCYV
jgi:hypothetical protein